MELRHIIVAVDESEAARNALRAALAMAHRSAARVTVMTTVPPAKATVATGTDDTDEVPGHAAALARLERWLEPEVRAGPTVRVGCGVTMGIPSVEVSRFAGHHGADLIVLGRKHRSLATRLLVGDTADSVARRSPVPCLLIPLGCHAPADALVALDGTPRSQVVLTAACGFAGAIKAPLHVCTVEPGGPDEPAGAASLVPFARTTALRDRIDGLHLKAPAATSAPIWLDIRRGPIVESLLAAVSSSGSDTIIVGFHRGGPPGVIDAGSTARRIMHSAPCAVMTVPL